MDMKRISIPVDYKFKELYDFYVDSAKLAGIEIAEGEEPAFDPTKIQISQELFDYLFPKFVEELVAYKELVKDDPNCSTFVESMEEGSEFMCSMIWLNYGASVRPTLTGRNALILDGFVADKPLPDTEDLGFNSDDWSPVTT